MFPSQPSSTSSTNGKQKYLPEDYKGKGEPSFSIEKALKDHEDNTHRRVLSDGNSAYEMQTRAGPEASRQRSASGSNAGRGTAAAFRMEGFGNGEGSVRRSHTTGRRVGEGLKKRFGSLRRGKNKTADVRVHED
jgi:hypothetical protein